MWDRMRAPGVTGQLERELRSTLAALEELGPAYEADLAAALGERLRSRDRASVMHGGSERRSGERPLIVPLAVAAGIAALGLFAGAARTHSAAWPLRFGREAQAAPGRQSIRVAPAPPAPPALPAIQ